MLNNSPLETIAMELDLRKDMEIFSFKGEGGKYFMDIVKYIMLSPKHMLRGGVAGGIAGVLVGAVSGNNIVEYMR